jgi:hypothetical protein
VYTACFDNKCVSEYCHRLYLHFSYNSQN